MVVASVHDLFAVDPAEFVAARDELVRQLKSDGQREEAAAMKALRRPPVPIWALNRVARDSGDAIDALLAAAAAAREARKIHSWRATSIVRRCARRWGNAERRCTTLFIERAMSSRDRDDQRARSSVRSSRHKSNQRSSSWPSLSLLAGPRETTSCVRSDSLSSSCSSSLSLLAISGDAGVT
jgi:hypothetical protein